MPKWLGLSLLMMAALALAAGFSFDFGAARKFYALAALVHGWIEIPILVLALDRSGLRTVREG